MVFQVQELDKSMHRRAAARRAENAREVLVEKAWFRTFLSILVLLYIQDLSTDIFVGKELIAQNRPIWGSIIVGLVLAPAALLAISAYQKRQCKMAIYAILFLAFFVRARESWLVTDFTTEFKINTHLKTLFGNLPMVLFQAYLLLSNHFVKVSCEAAFDANCAQECEGLEMFHKPLDFTRFTCNNFGAKSHNATVCWQWYRFCLDGCVANMVLEEMQGAVDTFDTFGSLKTLQVFVKPGEMYEKKRLMDRATKDFQLIMDQGSPAWVSQACWASASVLEPLMGEADMKNLGKDVRKEIKDIKTLNFRVENAHFQVLALLTHGISVAATLTLRILLERYTEDEHSATIQDMVWSCGRTGFCFGLHIFLDLAASAGACTFFGVSQNRTVKGSLGALICAIFIWKYSRARQFKRMPRYKQAGLALLHILLTPLSRAPGEPDLDADFLRQVVKMRVFTQLFFTSCGFYMLTAEDPRGLSAWRLELFITAVVILSAVGSTKGSGIRSIWTAEWDGISHGRSIRVYNKRRELKELSDIWMLWRIVRNPRYNPDIKSTHVPLILPSRLLEPEENILDFLADDNGRNAGAETTDLGLGSAGAAMVAGAQLVGTGAHVVASGGGSAVAGGFEAGGEVVASSSPAGWRSETAPKASASSTTAAAAG